MSMGPSEGRATGDMDADAGAVPTLRSTRSTADMADAPAAADPSYVAVFLLKYVCPSPGCGGTLAPASVAGSSNGTHVGNVCGAQRTHAQFLAALAEEDDSDMDDGGE